MRRLGCSPSLLAGQVRLLARRILPLLVRLAAPAALVLPGILSVPGLLAAQIEEEATLRGRLFLSGVPADSGTVTLHRITPVESGDLASIQVGPGGEFSYALPNLPIPGSGEIFIASSRYDGVLYFGAALTAPIQLDSLYTLEVFPTQAAPQVGIAFPIGIRNIFLEEGPMGWEVTDVFQVLNPSEFTFVPGAEGQAIWRYPLPTGAHSFRLGQGDLAPGTVEFVEGWVTTATPVTPGESLYIFQYDLPSLDFDVPVPGETRFFELLMREPAPAIRVEGLVRLESIELEIGTPFIRWAAEGIQDQTIRVRPGEESSVPMVAWFAVTLALLLAGAGSFALNRTPPRGERRGEGAEAGGRTRKDILVEIARLDERYGVSGGASEREQYQRARQALLLELEGSSGPRE